MQQACIHGGFSEESGFGPGTHLFRSPDLTTSPPRPCKSFKKGNVHYILGSVHFTKVVYKELKTILFVLNLNYAENAMKERETSQIFRIYEYDSVNIISFLIILPLFFSNR
ncbi:hypothetical protein AVEN_190838-1 [Araneus ventricosus]|uniref:Uncharacterized protein n=1 Tax=Araneus ventricosus TaxID=182803 RepID=A0A4Y2DZ90_ARAVE|nr:hypothetical protein AVEN_190838-1 [Araneus ventricosus]